MGSPSLAQVKMEENIIYAVHYDDFKEYVQKNISEINEENTVPIYFPKFMTENNLDKKYRDYNNLIDNHISFYNTSSSTSVKAEFNTIKFRYVWC